ncbi:Lrp/AsnC family transcriptional regulator [Brevibacterium sp. 50QC2O2]|uniref:Lrp/AsnC family transcriptional regulator n=1 Tax=Brevibacterium TaxID=1696 RepID=UPI00211D0ED5|nr:MULTISPECIES: Lrp/AsnC family transcriptional regulator [unclassified Brevibacterium]MCQ9386640.1 Lrp/AsnC family transcriptional regulator [Brevibacterium sp. 68QC2CO]MCQ9388473.1 Lrp/AsnC family transcriptional regulator [Brevibacterium sp. 50QC2O2]
MIHESQDSESGATDPVDLDIVDAIQLHPRAPWSVIAERVGVSEATVSRRWHRLRSSGLAWSGVALHPAVSMGAFLEIRCWSDDHATLIGALAEHPDVITIGLTTGDFNIFVIILGIDLPAVLRRVYQNLPELDLADRVRVSLFHRISGGVSWRQGLLKVPTAEALVAGTPPGDREPRKVAVPTVDLRPLFLELAGDARVPVRELARRLDTTPGIVSRQLAGLTEHDSVIFRCDVARPDFDYQVGILVLLQVPVLRSAAVAEAVGGWIETRFCTATTSAANIIVVAGLRDLPDSDRFLNKLARVDAGARVVDARIVTGNTKVYGWHLDGLGRAARCTPVDPWAMA